MRNQKDQSNQNSKDNASSVDSVDSEGAYEAAQLTDNRAETTLQKKLNSLAENDPKAQKTAQLKSLANKSSENKKIIQKKENKTGLPDKLKSGVESLSGYSMDDVRVHKNSDKPAQLNAHAYAQGTEIHLAPGQEKHLPHETWHVAQQKQGRVKPTKQMKSKVNINDDQKLEREADIMGAKAMQLKPNLLETENKSVSLQKRTVQLANGDMSPSLKDMDDINAIDQKASDKSMSITKQEYLRGTDMSPSLKDLDGINAIDQKASDKAMAVTKQEYLREQMTNLVIRVEDYAKAMDAICEEGISILELNRRLKQLVMAGMAISGLSIGLTIATAGVAPATALAVGAATLVPGLIVTLGKSVTKKKRDKKKKKLDEKATHGIRDNIQDGGEAALGTGLASAEAVGDFMKTALEKTAENAGFGAAGLGIALGVKDIFDAEKINLGKILGPRFFNEQMMNLDNIRATMDQLDRKEGKFPIKGLLSPKIDLIQSSIEKMSSAKSAGSLKT